jgi:hypothetical protein
MQLAKQKALANLRKQGLFASVARLLGGGLAYFYTIEVVLLRTTP